MYITNFVAFVVNCIETVVLTYRREYHLYSVAFSPGSHTWVDINNKRSISTGDNWTLTLFYKFIHIYILFVCFLYKKYIFICQDNKFVKKFFLKKYCLLTGIIILQCGLANCISSQFYSRYV